MRKGIQLFVVIVSAVCLVVLALVLYMRSEVVYTNTETGVLSEVSCKDCNVVLITMTNLRYDHLSSNGYFRPTTPHLDEFAKESISFDNAFSHSSWTLPEGISIYTGLYPFEHGIMNRHDGNKLAIATPTLIDVLNAEGYKTAAFTGGFDYNPDYGLTNRLEEYQECAKGQSVSHLRQTNPVANEISKYGALNCTIPNAIHWLRENYGSKFMLHVQGFDAHCPFSQDSQRYDPSYRGTIDYSACLWTFDKSEQVIKDGKNYNVVHSSNVGPEKDIFLGEEDVNHLIALYDESITDADENIGMFLKELESLGLSKNTIIIFTSEHGDMFGKYGRFMRGGPSRGTFYDDVIHVPLIIKYPGVAPKRADQLVAHIDLFPTILDMLGFQPPLHISGKSISSILNGGGEVHPYIFAGSEFIPSPENAYFSQKSRISVVRSKEWKLIEETIFTDATPSKTIELYNVNDDIEETYNVASEQTTVVEDLKLQLSHWLKRLSYVE